MQQELQVLFAAVGQEVDNFFVRGARLHDLVLGQRPAAVLINEVEAARRGREERVGKLFDLLLCRLRLHGAGRGAGLELGREGGLDRFLPLVLVDVAVAVRVEHEQRGLEARRDQQVLEVLVAAVVEEVDHFLRVETKCEAVVG